jgi:hypothetical protein
MRVKTPAARQLQATHEAVLDCWTTLTGLNTPQIYEPWLENKQTPLSLQQPPWGRHLVPAPTLTEDRVPTNSTSSPSRSATSASPRTTAPAAGVANDSAPPPALPALLARWPPELECFRPLPPPLHPLTASSTSTCGPRGCPGTNDCGSTAPNSAAGGGSSSSTKQLVPFWAAPLGGGHPLLLPLPAAAADVDDADG